LHATITGDIAAGCGRPADAFRPVLVGPVLDRVLNPASGSENIRLFTNPITHQAVYLQKFVPSHFTQCLDHLAYALVASTILKGLCDYAGTYLVNYGRVRHDHKNCRNELYESVLAQFIGVLPEAHHRQTLVSYHRQRHRACAVCHVQHSRGIPQQFFTFLFTAIAVVLLGGKLAWVLVFFLPFIVYSAGKIGRRVKTHHPHRTGQASRHPNISPGNHHRQPHCKSLQYGVLGNLSLSQSGPETLSRQFAFCGGGCPEFSPHGYLRGHRRVATSAFGPGAG